MCVNTKKETMKPKLFLLSLFLLSNHVSDAQYYFNHMYDQIYSSDQIFDYTLMNYRQELKNSKPKEIYLYNQSNKDSIKRLVGYTQFNDSLEIIKKETYWKKNGSSSSMIDIGKRRIINKDNRYETCSIIYTYDSLNNHTPLNWNRKIYLSKNKKKWEHIRVLNDENKISIYYIIEKEKLKDHWKYFYDNDQLSRIEHFKKGKLKSVTNYRCDNLGKDEMEKNQYEVCKNTTIDSNGNRVEVRIEYNKKGQQYKNRNTYLINTDSLIKSERFDHKNRLQTSFEVNGNKKIRIYYNNKGKELSKHVETRVEGEYFSSEYYFKQNLISKSKTTFNNDGLPIASKTIYMHKNPKKIKTYTTTYEYIY